MTNRTRRITRIGSVAGYLVAVSGAIALLATVLGLVPDQPWQTINDLVLLVLVAALAPLMLSIYELGGLTPTRLAQLAQALGWASVLTFCAIQLLQSPFGVRIEVPSGSFTAACLALGYVGLWISGANLLAGRWLGPLRWFGVLAGLAVTVFAASLLLLGGADNPWTRLGGIGSLILVPAWAFVLARLLGRVSAG